MSRFRAVPLALACAAACSSYGSEDDSATPAPDRDAGSDSSTPGDASAADVVAVDDGDAGPTKCDRNVPFNLPLGIPGLASNDYEGSPRLTADELHIFWNRFADGQWALWTASRQTKDDPFSTPLKLANVNDSDAGRDLDPSPTSDGLTLYFTSERLGGADIFTSTRGALTSPFPGATKVDEASGSSGDRRPFVAVDGKSLWFDSDRTGASRIYRLEVSAVGIGTPVPVDLGATNNTVHDEFAVLSHDGLALYFSGRGRQNEAHVFMATRATPSAGFANPVRIDKWEGFTAPGWISADECRLYVGMGGQGIVGTRLGLAKRDK